MTRTRGWWRRGEPLSARVPHDHWRTMTFLAALLAAILTRVTVEDDRIVLEIDRRGVQAHLIGGDPRVAPCAAPSRSEPIVLVISARLRRAGRGLRLVVAHGAAPTIDRALVTLLARATAARAALLSGEATSLAATAHRLGRARDKMTALMRISTLSPAIVAAILEGRQPLGLSARWLVRQSHDLPHDWMAQRSFLGFDDA